MAGKLVDHSLTLEFAFDGLDRGGVNSPSYVTTTGMAVLCDISWSSLVPKGYGIADLRATGQSRPQRDGYGTFVNGIVAPYGLGGTPEIALINIVSARYLV
ncbi:MAG: hypothetical protein AAAB35_20895 [Phyllobacterium sp.]|uniref:hypothetical protein n=1 Tax=Phyllobacterium sp. TaxID=1871046 RepID=UPI0030F09C54